jgi:hypothetical protein
MPLTRTERERVSDSRLKIKSAANNLAALEPGKVPDAEEIQDCLEDAQDSLKRALADSESDAPGKA